MKAPNAIEFHNAIIKEVKARIKQKHWEIIPIKQVPKREQFLPFIWTFKCNSDITTKLVFKHKARINAHVRKQEYASNLFKMFSHVVTWYTTRMVLVLSIINGWSARQVEFVLDFLQYNIEFDMYMEIPQGI